MKTVFLLLCLMASASLTSAADRPPNVIIIFCDDMGYADVACFGAKYLTPNIDRLAGEGRKFTNFHVSSAVCSASRAALLTGCYHSRVGIHGALGPGAKIGLNPDETTLAELFREKGYATGMAGKWHLGDATPFLPTHQGFDEWLGLPYSNDMWPHHPEAKPGTYPNLPMFEGDKVIDSDVSPDDQRQLTTRYTERAVDFIHRNKSKPFFFYLAHNMPHVPLFVSDKFAGKSGAGLYGDVIQEIDWSVGQILDALKQDSLEKDTWLIFTSDNGPWLSYGEHAGSAGPLREGKGTSWEGGTRVPCIMSWPGRITPGSQTAEIAMTIDLFPTIAAEIHATLPPRKIDGHNIAQLIFGNDPSTDAARHSATRRYAWFYANNQLQAVAEGSWKLVLPHQYRTLGDQPKAVGGIPAKYHQARVELPMLFDLATDIGERHNVADSNPSIVDSLSAFAKSVRSELGDSLTKTPASAIRPAARITQ